MKTKKSKKSKQKEKFKFIFPNVVAKTMKNVPMRTQLESSMISMTLIMSSLTLMVIYLLFWGEGTLPYRILLLVNLFAGFLFISSFLLTTYQQYISHMQMMGYDPQKERTDVLKRGHLFKRIGLALKERKKVKIKEKQQRKQAEQQEVEQEKLEQQEVEQEKLEQQEVEQEKLEQQDLEFIKPSQPNKPRLLKIVDEALERDDIINEQKAKDFKELQKQADKLKEEYIKQNKKNNKHVKESKGGITK